MKRFFKILLAIALVISFVGFIGVCVTKIPLNRNSYEMMLCAEEILSGDFFAYSKMADGFSLPLTDMLFYVIGVAVSGVGTNAFHIAVTLMYLFAAFSAVMLAIYSVERKWTAVLIMLAAGGVPLIYVLSDAYIHADIFAFLLIAMLLAHIYNETAKRYALIILGLIVALSVCCDGLSVLFIVLPLIILCCFKVFDKIFPVVAASILGLGSGIVVQGLYFHDFNMPLPLRSILVTQLWEGLKGYTEAALSYFQGLSGVEKAFFGASAVFLVIKIIILAFAVYIVYCAVKEVFRKRETDIPVAGMGLGMITVLLLLFFTRLDTGITIEQFFVFVPLVLAVCLARCTGLFAILEKRKATVLITMFCVLMTAVNICQLLYGALNL